MKFKITEQKIEVVEPLSMVEGTVNVGGIPSYVAEFEFDSSWDGFTKTVIFEADTLESAISVLLTGDSCIIPWELLQSEGTIRVGVRGDKAGNVYPTLQTRPQVVDPTMVQGQPGSTPTPSIYTQIVELMTSAATSASNAALSAAEAQGSANNAATAATNSATSASNAATSASNSATSASNAATSASNAQSSASASAISAASAAADAALIEDMTVEAETLATGEEATATITTVDEHFNISFGLPRGAKGDTGDTGAKGDTGDTGAAAGFGIPTATVDQSVGTASVTITSSGPDTAKVFNFAFTGIKGRDGAGSGDMSMSDYDAQQTVKNAGGIVAYVDANGGKIDHIQVDGSEQTITNKTVNLQGLAKDSDVNAIEALIPGQATAQNQLADKNFVNSSIENVAAYYITKNAAGDPFATKAELNAATTYYSGGVVRVPTRNDYCVVLADESKIIVETGENPTTRYIYNAGWEYQYIVNNSGLTAAQWAAVNSGATSALIGNYSAHIADSAIHVTASDKSTWSGKQDAISDLATIRSGASAGATAYQLPNTGVPDSDIASANTWNSKVSASSVTLTLAAASWSSGVQTVSVQGVTANTVGVFGLSTSATSAQYEAASKAKMLLTAQSTNSITVTAFGTTPTIDIPCVINIFQ